MNIGFAMMPFLFLIVEIAIVGFIGYFIIKKAVKDGICEAMEKLKASDDFKKVID